MLSHKLRLALTGLAVVLGVTFVSGTLVLTDTLHSTFSSLFNRVYENVDLQVRGVAAFSNQSGAMAVREPFSQSVLATIRGVRGVAVAEGGVGGYAQYVGRDGKAVATGGAPTIGMTYGQDPRLSSLALIAGTGPRNSDQVVIDHGTAKKFDFTVGQRVKILLPGAPRFFTISGIVRFGTADNLAGATIAAFTLPTAQRLFDKVGQLDTVDILVSPGANKSAVLRDVQRVLPRGLEVVTGQTVADENTSLMNQLLGFLSTALLVFAFIALFVGAFTIFNTFSIIVGQRTRELALLRIVGASRRQVFQSVLLEAFLLGLVASVIGLGLGVLTALGLDSLLRSFGISLPQGGLVFSTRTVFAALGVGIGVTVISAISPARHALRIPPIMALSSYSGSTVSSPRRRLFLGALVAAGGALILAAGLVKATIALVGVGAVAIFIGAGMLAPLVARPMSSVLGRPLAALLGVAGSLGRENSMRSPRRTAQTASALMIGLALVSTFSVFGASIAQSATGSIKDAVAADYIITGSLTGAPMSGISSAAAAVAAKIPGVATVTRVDSGVFEFQHSVVNLTAISRQSLSRTIILRIDSGRGASTLSDGGVLISSTTANAKHLKVGDTIHVRFAKTGPTTLRVGAIFKPNAVLGSYVVGEGFFHAHFASSTQPVVLLLHTSPGAQAASANSIKAGLSEFTNLKIQTREEFIQSEQAQVNQLLGLVYALLALAILIALIGIINTLLLSVFERTREIGLLRAVGMRRRQVRTMIRAEAVILSLFGGVIGIVLGTGLGIALSSSLKQQGITDIVVPYSSLAVFLVLAALLGLAAASWPARRAARLNILDAISVE
ncbi:MAG: ABC transporter permease [Acidimicrobiales bacterium]